MRRHLSDLSGRSSPSAISDVLRLLPFGRNLDRCCLGLSPQGAVPHPAARACLQLRMDRKLIQGASASVLRMPGQACWHVCVPVLVGTVMDAVFCLRPPARCTLVRVCVPEEGTGYSSLADVRNATAKAGQQNPSQPDRRDIISLMMWRRFCSGSCFL